MENIIKVPTSSYILENIQRIAFELQNLIQLDTEKGSKSCDNL